MFGPSMPITPLKNCLLVRVDGFKFFLGFLALILNCLAVYQEGTTSGFLEFRNGHKRCSNNWV